MCAPHTVCDRNLLAIEGLEIKGYHVEGSIVEALVSAGGKCEV